MATTVALDRIKALTVNENVHPKDQMFGDGMNPLKMKHYLSVGRSALLVIDGVLTARAGYPDGLTDIKSVLDFGCGFGRVGRYLRAGFPDADISGVDLIDGAAAFCRDQFGYAMLPEGPLPTDHFDLIWAGSVFTHFPDYMARRILLDLIRALKPNGVLVMTTQGRTAYLMVAGGLQKQTPPPFELYSLERQDALHLTSTYATTGYGFVNYKKHEVGVCIARPEWYSNVALADQNTVQIAMIEKGWDNHQDVLAFMKAPALSAKKGAAYF